MGRNGAVPCHLATRGGCSLKHEEELDPRHRVEQDPHRGAQPPPPIAPTVLPALPSRDTQRDPRGPRPGVTSASPRGSQSGGWVHFSLPSHWPAVAAAAAITRRHRQSPSRLPPLGARSPPQFCSPPPPRLAHAPTAAVAGARRGGAERLQGPGAEVPVRRQQGCYRRLRRESGRLAAGAAPEPRDSARGPFPLRPCLLGFASPPPGGGRGRSGAQPSPPSRRRSMGGARRRPAGSAAAARRD